MDIEFVVDCNSKGMRIDKFVSQHVDNEISRSAVQRLIKDSNLICNGVVITSQKHEVQEGDKIVFRTKDEKNTSMVFVNQKLNILYEDDCLVAINKECGQVVHPGNGVSCGTLVEAVGFERPLSSAGGEKRPGVVHRLDKDTSGVILFAKTDKTYFALTKMFAERKIHKTYIAIVSGIPTLLAGTIDAPIGRHTKDRTAMCVRYSGRQSITHWKLLERFEMANKALLSCEPYTGRTHQIRVHLKSIGYPIVGDTKYGKEAGIRLFLHAQKIKFTHPIYNTDIELVAPTPITFSEAINKFKYQNK